MRISIGTYLGTDRISGRNGYGYATLRMIESLRRLGYHVEDNDAKADVEIWFSQPQNWKWSDGPYKIGYHPWESTQLLPGWPEIMNGADEIWTPSPLIAGWYKQYSGITRPVYVYEHGIDHVWEPRERVVEDRIRFLHVGAEATRKGGWDAMRLFRTAFPERNDVELTLKIINSGWVGLDRIGKTNIINKSYTFEQLQDLFYAHHAYVYPSWGEGFGLTPLQAMATGMPTICTGAWAPYYRFFDERLIIGSEFKKSSWEEIHPGYMFRPKFDDVIDHMRYVADNYESVSDFAMKQTAEIHSEYDWDTITGRVFSDLEKRLK